MSYGLGPVNNSVVNGSQGLQNNGGGGNLGYMSHDKKEEKDDKKDNDTNLLQKNDDIDVVDITVNDPEYSENFPKSEPDKSFNPKNFIKKIATDIKDKICPKPSNPFHPSL